MKEFLNQSVFFGVAISVLTYELGVFLKKKLKWPICNPLLISIVAVIVFLAAFDIPYESYNAGAKYLSYLLTPVKYVPARACPLPLFPIRLFPVRFLLYYKESARI